MESSARICQWTLIDPLDEDIAKCHPQIVSGMKLKGRVFNHPSVKNGSIVTTGVVINFDLGGGFVETERGAKYLLGSPARL
jgi:predicted aconitase with swiveling domain